MCCKFLFRVWVFIALCLLSVAGYAKDSDRAVAEKQLAGAILFATGDRQIEGMPDKDLLRGAKVYVGDRISTGEDGYVQLRMVDEAYLSLKPNSTLIIQAYDMNKADPSAERVRIYLEAGVVRSKTGEIGTRNKQKFRLNTPVAAIGVRGTDFSIRTTDTVSQVVVQEGGIAMSPFGGGCTFGGLGACEGSQVRELFSSHTTEVYLELKKGSVAANLLEGRLEQLRPNVDDMFPSPNIEDKPESGDKREKSSKTVQGPVSALSPELEKLLLGALDRKELPSEKEGHDGDTDLDSVPDELDLDKDNDGIANALESWWLLNPLRADTDGDGFNDLDELRAETNPLYVDFDKDGIRDSEDSRPSSPDTVMLDGQAIAIAQLGQLKVGSENRVLDHDDGHWTMVLDAETPEIELQTQVVFDANAGVWMGDAASLQILQAVMQGDSWIAVQKQWALSVLKDGEEDRELVQQLVSQWQTSVPELIIEDGIGLLLQAGLSDLDLEKTYIYRPGGLANDQVSAENSGSHLKELVVDLSNSVFTAKVRMDSGEVVIINGRVQDGVLVGRIDDITLKGAITKGSQVSVIISEQNGSSFSELQLYSYHSQALEPELIEISHRSAIEWGRWSNFARLNKRDVDRLKDEKPGAELLFNKHFTISRQLVSDFKLPVSGRYRFELTDYEAIHIRGSDIVDANVESASLDIDMPSKRYAMYLGVNASSLSKPELLKSYGTIEQDGRMLSDDVLSNTVSQGFVEEHAAGAGLLFEKEIGKDEYISGSSYWTRNN